MNKYFLSLISILILFQSFKVADEIFHKPKAENIISRKLAGSSIVTIQRVY